MLSGSGKVVSLHLHPQISGQPLRSVEEVAVEADRGLVGDARIFAKKDGSGHASRRQVSLIAREELERHAAALVVPGIPPGAARSNIETTGIELAAFLGAEMEVGGAVLLFYAARTPCHKMDLVAPGLQALMSQGRQGVMARVIRSGIIRVGDKIQAKP